MDDSTTDLEEAVNGGVFMETKLADDTTCTADDIVSNSDLKPDMKVFDSLSSKIEDELRMLDWEMSSSIQDDVISDILGKQSLTDICMHGLPDTQPDRCNGESRDIVDMNGFHNPTDEETSNVKSPSKRRKLRKKDLAASRETLGSNTRSSVSSISSIRDDDDVDADFGDDEHNHGSETGSSCSSNEYGVDDEERRLAELQATELAPITVLTNRYLEDLDRVRFARNMAKIDKMARTMVNNALREVNTMFANSEDSEYWEQLFMDDSTLVGNIVFDSIPFPFEPRELEPLSPTQTVDSSSQRGETEVIFSKKFTTDNVIFTDMPVFAINSEIALKSVTDEPRNKYDITVETEADSAESVKSRRMLQRARFQMHDLQVELRKLKQQMTNDNKVESFVLANGNELTVENDENC